MIGGFKLPLRNLSILIALAGLLGWVLVYQFQDGTPPPSPATPSTPQLGPSKASSEDKDRSPPGQAEADVPAKPWADATLVDESITITTPGNREIKLTWKTSGKYPLIRQEIKETWNTKTDRWETTVTTNRVADHLIAVLPKSGGASLPSTFRKEAVSEKLRIFRIIPTPPRVLEQDDLESLSRLLGADSVIEWDPVYEKHIVNDPQYGLSWHLKWVGAENAWSTQTSASSQKIAVIDSGLDLQHPELVENLWVNESEIPDNGIDDDGNGYIDDIHGYDFVNRDATPQDIDGHGTAMAGIIGGVSNNEMGTVGITWECQLMAIQYLDDFGRGYSTDAIPAIEYAADQGASVINASWGSSLYSEALKAAIEYAGDSGALFVASAGNSSQNNDQISSYPSGYDDPRILSVASLNQDGTRSIFSNFGTKTVDVAAPGNWIYAPTANAEYSARPVSGTSPAAAVVSGIAAMIREAYPDLGPLQTKNRILRYSLYSILLEQQVLSQSSVHLYRSLEGIESKSIEIHSMTKGPIQLFSGEALRLQVTAQGPGPLSYQWLKDGQPIAESTESLLLLESTQLSDSGIYQVEVNTSFSSLLSQPITVHFEDRGPVIERGPGPLVREQGQFLELAFDVTGSEPRTYIWYKDGMQIGITQSPVWKMNSAQPENSGIYIMKVENAFGSTDSFAVSVSVLSAPMANWERVNPALESSHWTDLLWDGEFFCALSPGGRIGMTKNGVDWNYHDLDRTDDCIGIEYHDGLWIVYGDSAQLYFSTDRNNWTKVEDIPELLTEPSHYWPRIESIGVTSNRIVFSAGDLVYEIAREASGLGPVKLVELDGLGRNPSVVAGNETLIVTDGEVHFTNTYGAAWTRRETNIGRITFDGEVFLNGEGFTSVDGVTWSKTQDSVWIYDNPVRWKGRLYLSEGQELKSRDIQRASNTNVIIELYQRQISGFAGNDSIALAVGSFGFVAVGTSHEVESWRTPGEQISTPIRELAAGNECFLAVTRKPVGSGYDLWVSRDGRNWADANFEHAYPEIAFNGEVFLMTDGTHTFRSHDGVNWVVTHKLYLNGRYDFLKATEGLFWIHFDSSSSLYDDHYYFSRDGTNWTPANANMGGEFKVIERHGRYFAIEANLENPKAFNLWTSQNGETWDFAIEFTPSVETTHDNKYLLKVIQADHGYYFIYGSGEVLFTLNFVDWTKVANAGSTLRLSEIYKLDKGWIAQGDGIFTSQNQPIFSDPVFPKPEHYTLQNLVINESGALFFTADYQLFFHPFQSGRVPKVPELVIEDFDQLAAGDSVQFSIDPNTLDPDIREIRYYVNGEWVGSASPASPQLSFIFNQLGDISAYAEIVNRANQVQRSNVVSFAVDRLQYTTLDYPTDQIGRYWHLIGGFVWDGNYCILAEDQVTDEVLVFEWSKDEWIKRGSYPLDGYSIGYGKPTVVGNRLYFGMYQDFHPKTWEPRIVYTEDFQTWTQFPVINGSAYFGFQDYLYFQSSSDSYEISRTRDGINIEGPLPYPEPRHKSDDYLVQLDVYTNEYRVSWDGENWGPPFKLYQPGTNEEFHVTTDFTWDGEYLYALDVALLKSRDGNSWEHVLIPEEVISSYSDKFLASGDILFFVSTHRDGMYVSMDGGETMGHTKDILFQHETEIFETKEGPIIHQSLIGYPILFKTRNVGIQSAEVSHVTRVDNGRFRIDGQFNLVNIGMQSLNSFNAIRTEIELEIPGTGESDTFVALGHLTLRESLKPGDLKKVVFSVLTEEAHNPGEYRLRLVLDQGTHNETFTPYFDLGTSDPVALQILGEGRIEKTQLNPDTYQLEAIAAEGYTFTGWIGDRIAQQATISLPTQDSISVTAVFRSNTQVNQLKGTETNSGWYRIPWLGYVYFGEENWIYHEHHGWGWTRIQSERGLWFWDPDLGWLFFTRDGYPWIYWEASDQWIYFHGLEDTESGKERVFFDQAREKWFSIPFRY